MFRVYKITNVVTGSYYVGYTSSDLRVRWSAHKSSLKSGKKTKLYDNIRKYGEDNFKMELIKTFDKKEDALLFEESQIDLSNAKCLNLAKGGEGGFVVVDKESWRCKLSEARQGRKPALGLRHTEENKKLFSKVSQEYWSQQDTYDQEEVCKFPFSEAKRIFGISKTHYYRLRRQFNQQVKK